MENFTGSPWQITKKGFPGRNAMCERSLYAPCTTIATLIVDRGDLMVFGQLSPKTTRWDSEDNRTKAVLGLTDTRIGTNKTSDF